MRVLISCILGESSMVNQKPKIILPEPQRRYTT